MNIELEFYGTYGIPFAASTLAYDSIQRLLLVRPSQNSRVACFIFPDLSREMPDIVEMYRRWSNLVSAGGQSTQEKNTDTAKLILGTLYEIQLIL